MDKPPVIPVNRPSVPKNAGKYLHDCVRTGWFSSEGPFVSRFEESFASYLGVRYAASVSSGTAALHLALLALGVQKGDEVIVPAMTIASCYFAAWYLGATAVPVDADPVTYCMDPEKIERAITKRTKVLMAVHLFGHPCDMDPILAIAKKHKLRVLEDAAEAHGATYKGKMTGTLGDIGIFSFYANKIVTTGEGGMVVSRNKSHIDTVNKLKSLSHSSVRFIHDDIGYNYRMNNLQAAVGLASLEEITDSIKQKRDMAALYRSLLSGVPGLILPVERKWAHSIYWMYAVRTDPHNSILTRDVLTARLAREYGIATRTFFYSPKTAFAPMGLYKSVRFPVSEMLERTGFYLPSGLGNTRREFRKTARAIRDLLMPGSRTRTNPR